MKITKMTVGFLAAWASVCWVGDLHALNGAQLTGVTSTNQALGGGGAAHPQEISSILVNPAGLSDLPRQVNFNLLLGWPSNRFDSSAAPAGAGNAATNGNDDPLFLPGAGFILPTSYFDEKLTLGMGILPVAGFALDFPSSRISSAATGNAFDTSLTYGLLKVMGGAAYKINDQWSAGFTLHINQGTLSSNSAVLATGTETAGRGRTDRGFGIGFQVGTLYKPFDFLSAGLSYTSEQWMQEYERYNTDLLPAGLNSPQQVNVGVSVRPIERLVVDADFRWINYSGAGGAFGTPIAAGGVGWRDQYVGILGIQYGEIFDRLTLRAGYNYGRSPISRGALFANILALSITEHHLSGGFDLKLSENFSLDLSYLHNVSKNITDDGSQVAVGAGATAGQSAHIVGSEFSLKF